MFKEDPTKLGPSYSFLKQYSMKNSSYMSNIEDSELSNISIQKQKRSLSKRKKFKKRKVRKVSKVHTSRGTKPSGSDSFKLSLFKPNQIGVMLNSLSNLESNASNYSSTTISPPPRRMKNLR